MITQRLLALSLVVATALLVAGGASAAVPRNTQSPTISGNAREGETLTADNGTWDNSPTKFAYQWQRCSDSGTGCADVTGAQSKTYNVAASDADHTLRVIVTASNADGKSTAGSKPTDLISSHNGPVNTVKPSVSGTAQVGEELAASNGTSTGGVRSFSYQWERCDVGGSSCLRRLGRERQDLRRPLGGLRQGAPRRRHRHELERVTTATSATTGGRFGRPAGRSSEAEPEQGADALVHLAAPDRPRGLRPVPCLRRLAQVGDHRRSDVNAGELGYTRRFAVTPVSCSTASRHWVPASRFRTPGRLVITL